MPTYEIKHGRIAYTFSAAFDGMRKPDDWVIYPKKPESNEVTVQCGTRLARFDLTTGEGMISQRKSNGARYLDLNPMMGGHAFIAPKELCDALNACKGIVGNVVILGMSGQTKAQYAER